VRQILLNLKTTGNIYADWDIDALAKTMAEVLASESFPPSNDENP
jgi:hypothetical protein